MLVFIHPWDSGSFLHKELPRDMKSFVFRGNRVDSDLVLVVLDDDLDEMVEDERGE